MRIRPKVSQIQHDQLAAPKPIGITDLERNRIAQRRQPTLLTVAVRVIDEVVDDIEHMLQLGFGETSPFRRDGIISGVLRRIPLKADLRRNIAKLPLAEINSIGTGCR